MRQVVNWRKYSAKTRCFTAVKFDPVTKILLSPEAIIKQLANVMQMHYAQASNGFYNTERITITSVIYYKNCVWYSDFNL